MSETGDAEAVGAGEQLEMVPAPARARAEAGRARARGAAEADPPAAAATLPVARVLLDVPLAHLDRAFDYLVPHTMDASVVPGSRVKVRFAGAEADGFVLERVAESEHPGRLTPLRRAVSAEPVLTVEVARLCEAVAARYAGTRADVLRMAVPPRHARTEKREPAPTAEPPVVDLDAAREAWAPYDDALVDELATGGSPRVVWSALPGASWPTLLARSAAATAASGRGALLVAPDRRDVDLVDAALTAVLGPGRHVVLSADLGPAARYRAFLALSRGEVRVVIGTRAAVFAPVADLGLVALWDDGDDLYAEPRAPYPHAREVLLTRADQQSTAVLIGGFARTVEGEYLLRTGWAREARADRLTVRERAPRVEITGATEHDLARDPWARTVRLPRAVFDALRHGLAGGPVLVQTPRQGYASSLACEVCRAPARCRLCTGPLRLTAAGRPPTCRWCGTAESSWACAVCGGRGLRAPLLGEQRTGEELGRAFPSVRVVTSGGEHVLTTVEDHPAIVVATPGAEPRAAGGYACVVLLDTWVSLARQDLRTEEESLRRWLNAAGLARGAADGGRVVAVGDPGHPALQALVRWDPAGFAARELGERRSAHLPPASRMATLAGPRPDLESALATLDDLGLPEWAEVLGPVPLPVPAGRRAGEPGAEADPAQPHRVVLRVPRAQGADLSRVLSQLSGMRAARKLPVVRVQVDPVGLD